MSDVLTDVGFDGIRPDDERCGGRFMGDAEFATLECSLPKGHAGECVWGRVTVIVGTTQDNCVRITRHSFDTLMAAYRNLDRAVFERGQEKVVGETHVEEGTIGAHCSSMGAAPTYKLASEPHASMYGVPLTKYLPFLEGQRFRLTIEALPSPDAKEIVNPWRKAKE